MKIARPFEVIQSTAAPQEPTTPSHAGVHVTVITIAIVAAFALGTMQAEPHATGDGSAIAAAPEPAAGEPPDYFPAHYVNKGVDVPAHIEAF